MKPIDCGVIRDLLPSYVDKVSSDATNKLVEEHLKQCKDCCTVLNNMNKDIDAESIEGQDEQIDYLKGYRRNKIKAIIKTVIFVIAIMTIILIIIYWAMSGMLYGVCDTVSHYVDVNEFNVEYMYIDDKKEFLHVYLYSEKYKYRSIEGGYRYGTRYIGDLQQRYYPICGKSEVIGMLFDPTYTHHSGIDLGFDISDSNLERVYIQDSKNNEKEIWNRDMEVMTREEWIKWYVDSYVPQEVKELYNINDTNSIVSPMIWRHLYNIGENEI